MPLAKNSNKINKIEFNRKAFSLIELSVVLIIVSILITGALSASISSVNTAKEGATNDLLEVLYKALGNYLLINNNFPCPARLDLPKSDANYGQSNCTAGSGIKEVSTNLLYGMLPIKDLGILTDAAQDSFGGKIIYVIDKRLTNSSSVDFGNEMQNSGPSYTPLARILEKFSGGVEHEIKADLILISHGANQYGAFNAKSTIQNASDGGADEDNNDFSSSDNIFIASSESDDEFDDIILSKKLIEILQDFNAYHIIKCPTSTSNRVLYGSTSFDWPEANYQQIIEANQNCPSTYNQGPIKPTRKCSIYGQWGPIINPCLQSAT